VNDVPARSAPGSRAAVAAVAAAIHKHTCLADRHDHCTGATARDFEVAEAALGALGPGVLRIAAERTRQVISEGYTPEHDAEHAKGELAVAAVCYATPPPQRDTRSYAVGDGSGRGSWYSDIPVQWPWHPGYWRPCDRIRELTKAGALIAAEIDRQIAQGETDE
jgi:hypothetical protein